MGFSTLLDIMGSVIIGGVMMTIAYRLSDTMTEKLIITMVNLQYNKILLLLHK